MAPNLRCTTCWVDDRGPAVPGQGRAQGVFAVARSILPFPGAPAHPEVVRTAHLSAPQRGVASPEVCDVLEAALVAASTSRGPQLIYSREPIAGLHAVTQTGARRIVRLVEQEIAQRVQREVQERFGTRRTHAGNLPPQATEVGLRERLLDALLFFSHPA